MPSSSTVTASDGNVFGTAESLVCTDPPTQVPLIRTAISHRLNRLTPSQCAAGSDTLIRRLSSTTMDPRCTIGKPDLHKTPLPSDLHTAWAPYPSLNVTGELLEHQTAAREQFLDAKTLSSRNGTYSSCNEPSYPEGLSSQ